MPTMRKCQQCGTHSLSHTFFLSLTHTLFSSHFLTFFHTHTHFPLSHMRTRAGFQSSMALCKACILLIGLRDLPKVHISTDEGEGEKIEGEGEKRKEGEEEMSKDVRKAEEKKCGGKCDCKATPPLHSPAPSPVPTTHATSFSHLIDALTHTTDEVLHNK